MNEKDMIKAQRLNEAYKHLFAHHGITSQKAMAEHLGMQRTGLSAAMNGSKANLTDSLFKKICASWPGVFVLDYLLKTDIGSVLKLAGGEVLGQAALMVVVACALLLLAVVCGVLNFFVLLIFSHFKSIQFRKFFIADSWKIS